MSISDLLVPNNYQLFSGSLTTNDLKTPLLQIQGSTSGSVNISATATPNYNLVLPPNSDAGFLMNDGAGNTSWDVPGGMGLGNVIGPASATNTAMVLYNGTSGKLIKDSNITSDGDSITLPSTVNAAQTILTRPDETTVTLAMKRIGDANNRLQSNSDGVLEWGDGTATFDTTLQRTAAATITIADSGGSSNGTLNVGRIFTSGTGIQIGADTSITRSSAGQVFFAGGPFGSGVGALLACGQLNLWDGSSNHVIKPGANSGLKATGIEVAGGTSGSVQIKSPATVTTYPLTLPSAQGAAGQTVVNDGSGNLSWSSFLTPGVTSTTGNDSNGVFAATMNFTYAWLGPKTRVLYWSTVSTGSTGANNQAIFPVDTVTNFGTPDTSYGEVNIYWSSASGTPSASTVTIDSNLGTIHLTFSSGFNGSWTLGVPGIIYSCFIVVKTT